MDRTSWKPKVYKATESVDHKESLQDIHDSPSIVNAGKDIMKRQIQSYNDTPTPEGDSYGQPQGYPWQRGGEVSADILTDNWVNISDELAQCKHCNFTSGSWSEFAEHFKEVHGIGKDEDSDFVSFESKASEKYRIYFKNLTTGEEEDYGTAKNLKDMIVKRDMANDLRANMVDPVEVMVEGDESKASELAGHWTCMFCGIPFKTSFVAHVRKHHTKEEFIQLQYDGWIPERSVYSKESKANEDDHKKSWSELDSIAKMGFSDIGYDQQSWDSEPEEVRAEMETVVKDNLGENWKEVANKFYKEELNKGKKSGGESSYENWIDELDPIEIIMDNFDPDNKDGSVKCDHCGYELIHDGSIMSTNIQREAKDHMINNHINELESNASSTTSESKANEADCTNCGQSGVDPDPRFQLGSWCEDCQDRLELAKDNWWKNATDEEKRMENEWNDKPWESEFDGESKANEEEKCERCDGEGTLSGQAFDEELNNIGNSGGHPEEIENFAQWRTCPECDGKGYESWGKDFYNSLKDEYGYHNWNDNNQLSSAHDQIKLMKDYGIADKTLRQMGYDLKKDGIEGFIDRIEKELSKFGINLDKPEEQED